MILKRGLPALALGLAFSATSARAQSNNTLSIEPAGEPVTVYRWQQDRCEDDFIPDAPARAFRRADGKIALIATHRENWALVGPSFTSLHSDCKAILRSSNYTKDHLGELWIEGTYTRDGQNVIALVSQDLSVEIMKQGCRKDGSRGRCWVNNILTATSKDMGQSFQLAAGADRLVASLGNSYPAASQNRYGVFTTSNIVHKDDSYYMIAWTQGDGVQKPGNCLFRTDDPFKPENWRGWDGQNFSVDMRPHPEPQVCLPVTLRGLPSEVRSLTYSSKHGLWIAVFTSRQKLSGDTSPVPGFYFATSADLLNWSPSKRIMPAPTTAREQQMTHVLAYPSLIDPDSTSKNFDTIDGASPLLFFTLQHLANGNGTMNRDLQYVPLKIR